MSRPRLAIAILATAVASVVLTACASSVTGTGGLIGATPVSSASPIPSSPHPSAGGLTTQAAAKPPAGFVARDLTFVSLDTGWLLGHAAKCTSSSCPAVIVHTNDGGTTWTSTASPKATYAPISQNGCGSPCVWGLRFADTKIGYAYGPSALFLTTDGGATWQTEPGDADAIEIANGTVLRVSHTTPGCPPECTYLVSTAPIGSQTWKSVTSPSVTGDEVRMLRVGHRAFIEVYQNPAGGRPDAHATLLTSTDDGQHWTQRLDPCGTYGGSEADSIDMAVSDDGALAVLCRPRTASPTTFLIISTDAGATFGPPEDADGGEVIGLVNAYTPVIQNGANLARSTDGGAHWKIVATVPPGPPSGAADGVIGFESSMTGRWVPGYGPVLTSRNAGAAWTKHKFP